MSDRTRSPAELSTTVVRPMAGGDAAVRVLQVVGGSQFGGAVWVMLGYVRALQENGCVVTVCTSVERVAGAFRDAGCEIVSVPEMRREIYPPGDLVALMKLTRICRSGHFDVVHTHTSKGGFLGRAAARLARVPVVLHTSHGFAFHESSSRRAVVFFSALERIAGRWCDRIITVSEFHRRWALELRIVPAERIVTIHNGISRSRLVLSRDRRDVRDELGFDDRDFVLVSVGRLAAQKGLETLILALPEVLRRDARTRLVLVGEGPLRLDLERQVRAAGLAHVVHFLDFRTDIGDILNASDLMVAPSLREGLSISVLEAMAMGKPIVTTSIGSNLELIEDGVSGLLVPPEDPRQLADAILRIMADPDSGIRYGAAARDHFEREFTEQAMKDSLWDLYSQLLREKLPTKVSRSTPSDRTRSPDEPSTTAVRPMRAADIPAVVDVHLRAFPGFFLSFLGAGFLAVLYRSAVELDEIALVADAEGGVTGFVMGTADPGRFVRKLVRSRFLEFAIAACPALVRRPRAALRLARAVRQPAAARKPAGTATLMSLAVDPRFQARGRGRLLVEEFVAQSRVRGALHVDLTTDKYGNDEVNSFYVAMGFRVAREIITPEGRTLYEYVLDLAAPTAIAAASPTLPA